MAWRLVIGHGRRRKKAGQFLKGPICLDWLAHAARLPGKALAVAVALRFKAGVEGKSDSLKLSRELFARFGVSSKAGSRALHKLESAGLVAVERRVGRRPRVTLLESGLPRMQI